MSDRQKIEAFLDNEWFVHHPTQKAVIAAFRQLLTDKTTIAQARHDLDVMAEMAKTLSGELGKAASGKS